MSKLGPSTNSPIIWPSNLKAERDMTYESLDLLYQDFNSDTFGEHFGLIVSCSKYSLFRNNEQRGLLHKLEVTALPDVKSAKIRVTHEVVPGLHSCAQIIPVHHRLKAACFDTGSIIPIKNFGPGKNFNSDVRNKLSHHSGSITCLTSDSSGTRLASGCTAGEVALYDIYDEQVEFLSRTCETRGQLISSMSFTNHIPGLLHGVQEDDERRPNEDARSKTSDLDVSDPESDESLLIYATGSGQVCALDTRCTIAEPLKGQVLFTTEPRMSVTSLVRIRSKPGHLIYLGGSRGELVACDLRNASQYIYEHQHSPDDGTIRRMKEIIIPNHGDELTFLAYSNSSPQLQILDLDTMKPHPGWSCDRAPESPIKDLVQVRGRIFTCGNRCSIGCWKWSSEAAWNQPH